MNRSKVDPLPAPACQYGYTAEQIAAIVVDETHFNHWMYGQTMAVCDGRKYDHVEKAYRETGCGPHGGIVYASDLFNYLAGGPILD